MRTKPVIVIVLLLIVVAAAAAWLWHDNRMPCCVEQRDEGVEMPAEEPVEDDGTRPETAWGDSAPRPVDASPEGLYNDLKAASEDAHQKPSLEIERVPPPALPPPTRSEDDPA